MNNIKKFEKKEIDNLTSNFFDILTSLREYLYNHTQEININKIEEDYKLLCKNGEYFIKDSYILRDIIKEINDDLEACKHNLVKNNSNEEKEIGKLTLNFIDISRKLKDYINDNNIQLDLKQIKDAYNISHKTNEHLITKSKILQNLVVELNDNLVICECIFNDRKISIFSSVKSNLEKDNNNKLNQKKSRRKKSQVNQTQNELNSEESNSQISNLKAPDLNIKTKTFSREVALLMLDYQATCYYRWRRQSGYYEDDNDEYYKLF